MKLKNLHIHLVAAAAMAATGGLALAQSSTTPSGTTQSEMNRGVPGVDVDTGRRADGAVDINRANTESARGVPGVDVDAGRNARGAVDVDVGGNDRATRNTRAARADRG